LNPEQEELPKSPLLVRSKSERYDEESDEDTTEDASELENMTEDKEKSGYDSEDLDEEEMKELEVVEIKKSVRKSIYKPNLSAGVLPELPKMEIVSIKEEDEPPEMEVKVTNYVKKSSSSNKSFIVLYIQNFPLIFPSFVANKAAFLLFHAALTILQCYHSLSLLQ
jgi:hypothetical protein